MAMILPFFLTSCGDDKDEPISLEQQLIGEWVGDLIAMDDNGLVVSVTPGAYHWVFYTGNYGSEWFFNDDIKYENNFIWTLDGNKLTLKFLNNPVYTIYTVQYDIAINNNTLHIIRGSDYSIFTKVK